MNSKDRNNKSICEKSMAIVVNIVKLSSFSIARMSLGAPAVAKSPGQMTESVKLANEQQMSTAKVSLGAPAAAKSPGQMTKSVKLVANEPQMSQFSESRRSEKAQNSSKPVSFLMVPNKGIESSYVIHEDISVIDEMASAFIRKVHQKNRNSLSELSNLPQFILPPPPPPPAVI